MCSVYAASTKSEIPIQNFIFYAPEISNLISIRYRLNFEFSTQRNYLPFIWKKVTLSSCYINKCIDYLLTTDYL